MLFHEGEDKSVSASDDEAMFEDVDDGSNVEIRQSVELRPLGRTAWLRYTRLLQELAANDARVLHRRFVDCHHVVRQTVRDDEPTTFVFCLRGILIHITYDILGISM